MGRCVGTTLVLCPVDWKTWFTCSLTFWKRPGDCWCNILMSRLQSSRAASSLLRFVGSLAASGFTFPVVQACSTCSALMSCDKRHCCGLDFFCRRKVANNVRVLPRSFKRTRSWSLRKMDRPNSLHDALSSAVEAKVRFRKRKRFNRVNSSSCPATGLTSERFIRGINGWCIGCWT